MIMTKEIKDIIENNMMDFTGLNGIEYKYSTHNGLKQLLIEICELQKIECAKQTDLLSGFMSHIDNAKEIINLTKNIAENE